MFLNFSIFALGIQLLLHIQRFCHQQKQYTGKNNPLAFVLALKLYITTYALNSRIVAGALQGRKTSPAPHKY